MSQSFRILFVLVLSCFFTHVAQASFPESMGGFGIRKTFENDWFDYGKNRLKLSRADDSAVTFFNVNCKDRKKMSAKYVSTAMENGQDVAKYTLQFNKKAVPHFFYLICKQTPTFKKVKLKDSDTGRLIAALESLDNGMGLGEVTLDKQTCYVSVLGKNGCPEMISSSIKYPTVTAIINGLNKKYSKLSTLEKRAQQAVKDKCLKFEKDDELDECTFYTIKFYPKKNSKKHTTLETKIGRLSPECDCEIATTITTELGAPAPTTAEAINDLGFLVKSGGLIDDAIQQDKQFIENQPGYNDFNSPRLIGLVDTSLSNLGFSTDEPRRSEFIQELFKARNSQEIADLLDAEGLLTPAELILIRDRDGSSLSRDLSIIFGLSFGMTLESFFNGDNIPLNPAESFFQFAIDNQIFINFNYDITLDFFSQDIGDILPNITAGLDAWITKYCSAMTVTASTMGGDVSSLKGASVSKTYPASLDQEAIFCMMQKHKPWFNSAGYRYRAVFKDQEHRTAWNQIQKNRMLVLKRTDKTEDGKRLYDLFSTADLKKRLHRIRIDREKLRSSDLGQTKYMQTNEAIGCMTDAFYNLALQSRGCGKVVIGDKEFMISPKEILNGTAIDQKKQAKRLIRMAKYLKKEFNKPDLKERATKAARREKLRLKVLSQSDDEICYKLWIQGNGKKLHSVYFTLKSTVTMSLITNPQSKLCECVIAAKTALTQNFTARANQLGPLSINGEQTVIGELISLLGRRLTPEEGERRYVVLQQYRDAYNRIKKTICTDLPADIRACINANPAP